MPNLISPLRVLYLSLALAAVALPAQAAPEQCYQLLENWVHPVPAQTLCVAEEETDVALRLFTGGRLVWSDEHPALAREVEGRCVYGRDDQLLFCHRYKEFSLFPGGHVESYSIHIVGGSERSVEIAGRAFVLRPQARHPERFFANAASQARAPAAFALQPAGAAVLAELEAAAASDRDRFVAAVQGDRELLAAIARWEAMTMAEQVPWLHRVFELEWRALGIRRPALEIGPDVTPGAAFFAFDTARPDAGKILLNTRVLAAEPNKLNSLLLLIHETRHAAQFQQGFGPDDSAVARGLRAAFQAQQDLAGTGTLTFCDFTTLLNEYEAFQFANYVVGRLSGWRAATLSMGTYASQFDEHEHPRIDLLRVAGDVEDDSLLDAFNVLVQPQFELLRGLR